MVKKEPASLTESEAGEMLSTIETIVAELGHKPGALLPILQRIQSEFNYVPPSCVPVIARGLNQSHADIHGVISFYHEFRQTPPGTHIIQVCRAEACQSMGSEKLEEYAKSRLGVDFHQTTRDNNFTLEPVYCLGNCMCSPSVRVGDAIHSEMTPEKLDVLLDSLLTQVIEVKTL